MAISVKHAFESAISDDPTASAAGEVLPSHWNAEHTVTGLTTAEVTASTDKNYVTDAQLTVIGNTSGTNSGNQNVFTKIAVSGQSDVVADSTTDTLTLVAGTNVTITTDATTDTVTIAASGGGGTPGGSSGAVQGNTSSAFAGIPGFTYDTTTGALTHAAGTITASTPAMSITQTWNASGTTFTGWKMNVTNTASAAGSLLADWQVGGTSLVNIRKDGALFLKNAGGIGSTGTANPSIVLGSTGAGTIWSDNNNGIAFSAGAAGASIWIASLSQTRLAAGLLLGWSSDSTNAIAGLDTGVVRNAAGVLEVNSGTAGTFRDLKLRNLIAGGGNGSYIGTPSMTVANLAAAATAGAGARAFVTDATATTFLSTVAGGGANKVPVVSDGTNWLIG